MGRNLSPVVRRQLENLDKDSDSRRSAMNALKSYVKDLDPKAKSLFLAQVSETKETGLTSSKYTISLYEVLARVTGPKIVPHIDDIMLTIVKTLTSSASSFALHQACAKVVTAIARYGMDPTTPNAKKGEIVQSLCKPLSDSLLSSQENLSSGAALCLRALVESDNWRFSSSHMVNEVCQRVAAALGKPMQTNSNSHIRLVMALAKHNGSDVEDYARLLIRAGVGILNMGVTEGNSQKRLSAIQMVNFLMRCLDYKCMISELPFVIEEFQKCQTDQTANVKVAAFEAIQRAKRILAEKGSKQRHRSVSPRSQTIDSFGEYGSSISYSPLTISFASRERDPDSRSINRKLWSNVDVSLKDGLFSGEMSTPRSVIESSETQEDYDEEFSGFVPVSPTNGGSNTPRSATPSPQRSRSYVNVENTDLFTTPRKLVRSLQVSNSDCSDNQSRGFRSPPSSKFNWSPNSSYDQNGFDESFADGDEQFNGASESVSSTEDIQFPTNGSNSLQQSQELVPETKVKSKVQMSPAISIASGLCVLLIAVVCFLWIQDVDASYNNLVPT